MIKVRPLRCQRCWGAGHRSLNCPTIGKPKAYGHARNPATVAPSFTPPPRKACDDKIKFSNYPGPSRLHEGMSNAETIAWRRARTREDAK
jgi:hypothetical protein